MFLAENVAGEKALAYLFRDPAFPLPYLPTQLLIGARLTSIEPQRNLTMKNDLKISCRGP